MKEIFNENVEQFKGNIFCNSILDLANSFKLKGYTIIDALTACMVEVIHSTASKTDKEFFTKVTNEIHKNILKGLLNYEEIANKVKEEKTNE